MPGTKPLRQGKVQKVFRIDDAERIQRSIEKYFALNHEIAKSSRNLIVLPQKAIKIHPNAPMRWGTTCGQILTTIACRMTVASALRLTWARVYAPKLGLDVDSGLPRNSSHNKYCLENYLIIQQKLHSKYCRIIASNWGRVAKVVGEINIWHLGFISESNWARKILFSVVRSLSKASATTPRTRRKPRNGLKASRTWAGWCYKNSRRRQSRIVETTFPIDTFSHSHPIDSVVHFSKIRISFVLGPESPLLRCSTKWNASSVVATCREL